MRLEPAGLNGRNRCGWGLGERAWNAKNDDGKQSE
jgi:hypothetical protein